jgi:hypothetical protein
VVLDLPLLERHERCSVHVRSSLPRYEYLTELMSLRLDGSKTEQVLSRVFQYDSRSSPRMYQEYMAIRPGHDTSDTISLQVMVWAWVAFFLLLEDSQREAFIRS